MECKLGEIALYGLYSAEHGAYYIVIVTVFRKETVYMATSEEAQEYISFLRRLRAVRQFTAEPVPQEVIDAILPVVRWSGSARNLQPWDLIVIRNGETLRQLATFGSSATHLAGASVGIALVMAGNPEFVQQETFDEGRLSERIMLAAQAYGVGSCIGWFKGEAQTEAKALLGVPQERLLRTAISLGYTDEEARRTHPKAYQARKPLEEFVHLEKF